MKPETKFKRAVVKLAKSFGIVAAVNDYMSGLDSRTKQAWRTFSLKTDTVPPADFLTQLEAMNSETYHGIHAMTGLPFKVGMAVRYLTIGSTRHTFFNQQLTPIQ